MKDFVFITLKLLILEFHFCKILGVANTTLGTPVTTAL